MEAMSQKPCGYFFLIATVISLFFTNVCAAVLKKVVGKVLPK